MLKVKQGYTWLRKVGDKWEAVPAIREVREDDPGIDAQRHKLIFPVKEEEKKEAEPSKSPKNRKGKIPQGR